MLNHPATRNSTATLVQLLLVPSPRQYGKSNHTDSLGLCLGLLLLNVDILFTYRPHTNPPPLTRLAHPPSAALHRPIHPPTSADGLTRLLQTEAVHPQ